MLGIGFETQLYIIIGVLSLMVVVCFVLIMVLSTKLEKITKRQKVLNRELGTETVDVLLEKCLDKQEDMRLLIEENQGKIKNLESTVPKCFDKVEVVRYSTNPQDENSLSFSIGITNPEENGVILTGMQTLRGTKLTVKKVKKGSADEDITDEELSVIDRD